MEYQTNLFFIHGVALNWTKMNDFWAVGKYSKGICEVLSGPKNNFGTTGHLCLSTQKIRVNLSYYATKFQRYSRLKM